MERLSGVRSDIWIAPGVVPSRRRRDWWLAAGLGVVALLLIVVDDTLPLWARVPPSLLAVGFVPVRRQVPLLAVTTVQIAAVLCVVLAVGGTDTPDVGSVAGVADIVLLYALFRWSTPAKAGVGLVLTVAGEAAVLQATGGFRLEHWVIVIPWLALGAFALAMRYRATAAAQRHEQVRLEERHALARDLHDTVAHHVTAIAVQAQAGRYVTRESTGPAATVLASIEELATDCLAEMRHMVGALRLPAEQQASATCETLQHLAVSDGVPMVDVQGGELMGEVSAGARSALFRIAQESITNARRHSRDVTAIDIDLSLDRGWVHMTIDNDGTPVARTGSGFGIVGMRERALALGGSFESAAGPAGGWRTHTSIPTGPAAL